MTRPALPLGTLNAGEGSLHPPISNVLVEEVRDGYGSEDLQQMVTVRALCVTENNLNDVWTASTAEASSLPAKARSLARRHSRQPLSGILVHREITDGWMPPSTRAEAARERSEQRE
ncbi:hypothetical protein EV122DRAFT_281307 [Schizophyllum commune]